jgi:UDP-N-acetylmuramyl pentapeptide phosphotransferase/UDP-N-acetylglucosamine-1-phosphate transferase
VIADNVFIWMQIGALAFFTSLAICGFMCWAGLGDASDSRSAHQGTIPTSGGVGLLAGMGVALCAAALIFPNLSLPRGFASVISLLFAVGMLGLVDDALTLGAKSKFGIMIAISAATVWLIGAPTQLPFLNGPIALPSALGFSGAMLWIFVVLNAVNFMDGSNGMIGASLLIANLGLFGAGIAGGSAITLLLSGLSVMIILGFLPYNLRQRAHIFLGDVGSLSLGFLFAVTVLFLIQDTPDKTLHLVGPILILPLLADVLLTLVRRVRNRENLLEAHNTHLYQRLIRHGLGHPVVRWFYVLAALVCANVVVIGASRGWLDQLHIPLMLVGAITAAYWLISQSLKE